MSDEQMIYLDPNDGLNRVIERLEGATKQRVVLIVPPQTQLRSNVFWRLLHSRARGMGKDVTVVSADRQVRSVAKIAGFRIGDASASSSSSKPSKTRSSAPVRSSGTSRQERQPRSSTARRTAGRQEPLPHNLPMPSTARPDRIQRQPVQADWREAETTSAPSREMPTTQEPVMDIPPPQIQEDDYDRPFEFRIDSSQANPLIARTPRKEEIEEQDPFIPDYETSRGFLESWQSAQPAQYAPPVQPVEPVQPAQIQEPDSEPTIDFSLPPVPFEPVNNLPELSTTLPKPGRQPDPFDLYDDDHLPPSLPEQRGSAFVHDLDDGTPDIADMADDVATEHKIEDLGDLAEEEVPLPPLPGPHRQWPELLADEPEEEEPPRRVYGSRPRGSRSGTLQRRPNRDFYGDEDQLAPIEDRPTVTPILPVQPAVPASQHAPRQSGGLAAARATGAAAPQSQRPQRNVSLPARPPAPAPAGRTIAPVSPGPARPAPRPAPQPRRQRRGGSVLTTVAILLVLLFLIAVGFFYFGTSATVIVTVPSQKVSASKLKLVASTNPQNKAQNTVASQVLSFTASATGPGTATGKTPLGSSKATGQVNFTNNGSQPVHIPIGTAVSTPAGAGSLGVTFFITVDAVIPANAPNNVVPLNIQAQNAGASGDVGPGTITVIPADSLTAIAKANGVSPSALNLSVTNPSATVGGGAANVPTVTNNDLAALKLKLHQQLQAQVKAWQQTLKNQGEQVGASIPDVLGSANPLPQEILSGTPFVGKPLTSTTITGTLTIQIKALVVRAVAIEAGAQHQLDLLASKLHPRYTISTAVTPVQVSNIASSSSSGGNVLTITFNAVGQAALYVDTGQLRSYLAGKTVSQATSDLDTGDAAVPGVQNVKITVSPSILNLMPFRPDRINIIVQPSASSQPQGKPNG